MDGLPFLLTRREDKGGVYYVRFRRVDGSLTLRKSTGEKSKKDAIAVCFKWMQEGASSIKDDKVAQERQKRLLEKTAIIDKIKGVKWEEGDVVDILEAIKKGGFISDYSLMRGGVDAFSFLCDFWDYEKSEYIKERARKGQAITRNYAHEKSNLIKKQWSHLQGRFLCNLTKNDLLDKMNELDKTPLSNARKNGIIKSILKPLRYAFKNDIIQKDITSSIVLYSNNSKKRAILTPEIASSLFAVEWNNNASKLANLLAMVTGMRAGEIASLQLCDLGADCIYLKHSWNSIDGLKSTKNGEERTVYLPFPSIIKALKRLAYTSPHNNGLNNFIFYSSLPNKPCEARIFVEGLHEALKSLGIADYKQYTFHGWRHYFATYMKTSNLSDKVLQAQTGHKTLAMLNHYANHKTDIEVLQLEEAQKKLFGGIVSEAL